MADRITISTDCLRDISRRLRTLENDLTGIRQQLAGVELLSKNGGNVHFHYSCRLTDGSNYSGEDIRNAVKALERASLRLGSNATTVSGNITNAAISFENNEKNLVQLFFGRNAAPENERYSSPSDSPFPNHRTFPFGISSTIDMIRQRAAEEMRAREAMKREYAKILHTSDDPASNPRIYEIIDDRLEDCGFTKKHRDLVIDRVKNAPADFRDIYLYSFYDYEIKDGRSNGYNGIYQPSDNTMYVNSSAFSSDESFIDCYFHETGHAIDTNAGDISTNGFLLQYLQIDTESFINKKIDLYGSDLTDAQKRNVLQAFMDGDSKETSFFFGNPTGHAPNDLSSAEKKVYNKVVQSSYYELRNTSYESDCMPWDILTGMTNNTITSGGGHRKDYAGDYYWFDSQGERTGLECKEAWAEYFSSMMTGDTESQRDNAAYLPQSSSYMNRIADNLVLDYRGE